MEATLLPFNFEAELRAFQRERSRNRSKGRHVSECIHHIAAAVEPRRFGNRGEIDPVLAQGGFLWEDVMSWAFARQFRERGWEQEEIWKDGIWMTLDGWLAGKRRVRELKVTKMSARNPIRSAKFWHWHMQIQAYCFAKRTTEAELYPLFLNGGYELGGGRFGSPTVGIDGHGWLLEYTVREMQENWDGILRARDELDEMEAA